MGATRIKDGIGIIPTTVAAGIDGTIGDARVYSFKPPVSMCVVANHLAAGKQALIRVNGAGDGVLALLTNVLTEVLDGDKTVDLSYGGRRMVHTVEIATEGADDLDNIYIHGWN